MNLGVGIFFFFFYHAVVPLDLYSDFEVTSDEIVICLEIRYFLLTNMSGAKYHIILIFVSPQCSIKGILLSLKYI